jgi:hypothetical protein
MSTIGSLLEALPKCVPYLTPLVTPEVQVDLERAIRAAEAPNMRRRKLPSAVTFVLTLLLGAWRNESELEVFERLRVAWKALARVTDGAIAHARKRLGIAAMRQFFEGLCVRGRPEPSFHGLRVYAVDGVRANMPDTPANRKRFRRPACCHGGPALPQVLLVILAAVSTRCIGGVTLLPCRTGEREPALKLLQGLGAGDLVIFDSGFYAAWFIQALDALGISYIVRMPRSVKNLESLADPNWFQIRTVYLREGRRRRRKGRTRQIQIQGRVVAYRVGRAKVRLFTNLPARITHREIAHAYHLRWEVEILGDELKTHLTAPAKGTCPTPLRSKTPELIEQEIYSLLALYNLLRLNMAAAAQRAGVPALNLSFVNCLRVVRRAIQQPAPRTPAAARNASRRMLAELARCLNDRPRRPRQAPRVVRKPQRPFPGKRRHHKTRRIDFKSRVRIAKPA